MTARETLRHSSIEALILLAIIFGIPVAISVAGNAFVKHKQEQTKAYAELSPCAN